MVVCDGIRQGLLWHHTCLDGLVVWISRLGVFDFFDCGDVMNAWTIVNILVAWLLWTWAQRDFEAGHNKLGWFNIFFSAWNAAAAANAIF